MATDDNRLTRWGCPDGTTACGLEADLVSHSATKFIGGHGDVMGGVVTGARKVIDSLRTARNHFGGMLSPHNASLLLAPLAETSFAFLRPDGFVRRWRLTGLPGRGFSQPFRPWLENPAQAALARFLIEEGGVVGDPVEASGCCSLGSRLRARELGMPRFDWRSC
jgi:hypothetical protein